MVFLILRWTSLFIHTNSYHSPHFQAVEKIEFCWESWEFIELFYHVTSWSQNEGVWTWGGLFKSWFKHFILGWGSFIWRIYDCSNYRLVWNSVIQFSSRDPRLVLILWRFNIIMKAIRSLKMKKPGEFKNSRNGLPVGRFEHWHCERGRIFQKWPIKAFIWEISEPVTSVYILLNALITLKCEIIRSQIFFFHTMNSTLPFW